ncbi:MAG: c-type cytochrome, partial [Pseudomonadota bacterium]|nr:c-type cytochrome [Pseudomonadota bacterium]
MKLLFTLVCLSIGLAIPHANAIELKPDDKAVVAKGKSVYKSQCAACHGFSLRGQRNWRVRKPDGKLPAPPHDKSGHTWHHSSKVLFDYTKLGPKALIGRDYQTD